ncbi:MAG TPA: glucoamylase family protein, partial [Lacunisphaera sp.]|nr:glucoamylase family protein [Lacunisphaera sp.]
AIVAREYFADAEITALVNRLLADVDWNWFRNGGQLVSLSWHDETGFSRYRWNKYSEHVLMSYLSLGLSPRPLEAEYWHRWQRFPLGRYQQWVYLQEPPLFINQFPQAFLDLRDRRDAYADYFQNTRLATLAQRQFSLDLRAEFPAWHEDLWGLTASDSATGYKAWGGPPRTLRYNALDGTVVPCAAAGSLPFAPKETLSVLHHMRTVWGDRIWKRYGFVDAFNPHNGWINPDVIGIDVGISVLQAENLRTGLIQRLFMQSPEAQLSLSKAGLLNTSRRLDPAEQKQVLAHAAASWRRLSSQPAPAGLQLTALLAAQHLGLVSSDDFLAQARAALAAPPATTSDADAAQYAASLLTLRQAVPALAAETTRRIEAIDWKGFPNSAPILGTASRLAVFLQIAAKARPASDWQALDRSTLPLGPVLALAPADAAGALVPGLWLDEEFILSGASAAQLAYASLTGIEVPESPLLSALQLDRFPRESFARLTEATSPEAAAAHVITAANLLMHDVIRRAFQQDPLVQAGRAAIGEFAEAAFGPDTSVIAQRELSRAPRPRPSREATAVSAALPREHWDWQHIEGLEYKDSEADLRPEDPPLRFRFAVTWDKDALHFHAEVTDNLPGYRPPEVRNRLVEVFVDPAGDGLIWTGPKDYQFTYRVDLGAKELFNDAPSESVIEETPEGYTVAVRIPWSSLNLVPGPGLTFGLSAAAISEGTKEWEPMIKLNWSYETERAGEYRLGRIRLL